MDRSLSIEEAELLAPTVAVPIRLFADLQRILSQPGLFARMTNAQTFALADALEAALREALSIPLSPSGETSVS